MEVDFTVHILQICEALNKHTVEYMIVGGVAVALYGYFRKSIGPDGKPAEKPDLDIWYNPTYNNNFKLLAALGALGQEVSEFKNELAPNPKKSFFKYDLDNLTLDLLPKLKNELPFQAAFRKRELVSLNKIDIPFMGYEDLISDKEASGREKDLADIEYLKNKIRP